MQERHPDSPGEADDKENGYLDVSYHDESESAEEDFDSSHDSAPFTDIGEHNDSSKSMEIKQILDMARGETTNLQVWRLILLLGMVLTCALVTTGTFLFLKGRERNNSTNSVRPLDSSRIPV